MSGQRVCNISYRKPESCKGPVLQPKHRKLGTGLDLLPLNIRPTIFNN